MVGVMVGSTFLHTANLAARQNDAEGMPSFAGPTPGTMRNITIQTVDISGEAGRHVIVARGTPDIYQGHTDTLLMPDGKTLFAAWSQGHAVNIGPLKRSNDGGRTWSDLISVPDNWFKTSNTPTIHRLLDPDGKQRLCVFGGGLRSPGVAMQQSVSEDGGRTWSAMRPNGLTGEVPPKSVMPFEDGKKWIIWSDMPGLVWQSETADGGLTWKPERPILKVPGRWSQPSVIRSPDGRQLLMLMRENTRKYNSLYSVSNDNARTWSEPKELHAALTGDRHVLRYAPDGRLVIAMRAQAKSRLTYGHYVAWVGRYADIIGRREGQYRIKLFHNHLRTPQMPPGKGNYDCGYSGLEVVEDGSIIAITYVKYQPGPEKNSVVSTRFRLEQTDAGLDLKGH